MNAYRIGLMVVLLASLGPGGLALAQGPGMPPPPVGVASVVQSDVAANQTFVGTVMPVRTSSVGSAVDGRVVEFPANEGDRVKKGQVLAQLLTGQLDIQLAGAEAELELRRHELEELQNGTRQEEIDQAQARYESRKAAWDYAKARMDRMQRLVERSAVTTDETQESASLAYVASQALNEARSALDLAKAGPRQEAIAQAKARVAMQTEDVNAIKDQIVKHTIRAPFDGYLVEEHTEIGQWVAKAGMVATVVELDQVDVEIMVLETYLPALRVGAPARVEVPALPGRALEGSIAMINPKADHRSRSFPVKVRLDNQFDDERPLLAAGMFARVTLPVGGTQQALLVPKDAVVLGGPTPVVFVVDLDPKNAKQGMVRKVDVDLGLATGNQICVKGELKAGQKVVVQGNERLRPGMPVTILREVNANLAPTAAVNR